MEIQQRILYLLKRAIKNGGGTIDEETIKKLIDESLAEATKDLPTKTYVQELIDALEIPEGWTHEELESDEKPTGQGVAGTIYVQPNGIMWVWSASKNDYVKINGLTDLTGYLKTVDADNKYVAKSQLTDLVTVEQLKTIPVFHVPEVFIVADPPVTTFALDKKPMFISEVLVLNGEDTLHYLQEADWSLNENSITINNPTLTSGMRVKVIYTYSYGS